MLSRQLLATRAVAKRQLQRAAVLRAKNDSSTIDSYKLPSQTSIHEWEFRYDFVPKVSEPKIPALTADAVKQEIARDQRAKVEKELFVKEGSTSIKVEANDSHVVHGGEHVGAEPEYLHDRSSEPVDSANPNLAELKKKPANRDKYVQSSLNPDINSPDVVSLSHGEVSHKASSTEGQAQVLEDVEHEEHESLKAQQEPKGGSGSTWIIALGGAGAGYFGYNYFKGKSAAK